MPDKILGFFNEHRYLSNFHITDVMFEGVLYPSSECAYQAAKTLDLAAREKFVGLSPKGSKKAGRDLTLRSDWETVKYEIMYQIVKDKFTRNEDLNKLLLGTGNAYLEETNTWGDKCWGVCRGVGSNNLGRILMRVRAEARGIKFVRCQGFGSCNQMVPETLPFCKECVDDDTN